MPRTAPAPELEVPRGARDDLDRLSSAITAVEGALGPFLDADATAVRRRLRPLERAEAHLEIARAIAALFAMYLRAHGIDPTRHAVARERTRMEAYAKKIEETRARVGDGARGASAGGRTASVSVKEAARALGEGVGSPGDLLRAALDAGRGDVEGEKAAKATGKRAATSGKDAAKRKKK